MNKWIKRGAFGLGALALLAGCAGVAALLAAEWRMTRTLDIAVAPLALDQRATTMQHGRYLFSSRGCAHCHGDDGAGRRVIDADGMLVVAPNITRGAGSVVTGYSSQDWVRVLRHGVKPDGTPVMIMPSEDWARMSDSDASALIGYTIGLPPVAGQAAVIKLPLPVRVLYGAGLVKDAAAKIDHSLPVQAASTAAVSLEHGKYLASMCMGCHGATLGGGAIPGAPPSWPAAANLTPGAGSVLPVYRTAEQFRAMMRTGRRPDGSAVDPSMPFEALRTTNDTDLDAMLLYFRSLPPVATGQRH